ncbi:MAG: DNA translocase FtsK [Sphingobacteriales bacterium]|nr:MAG: DNA translocase FtsK [Sphingobacteriales bacterium]
MASPKKIPSKKAATPPPVAPPRKESVAPRPVFRRRQARLLLGTLLFIAGAFTLMALLSYFFTWQTDQDLVSGTESATDYLVKDRAEVANWGGRLGASLSHALVFRGVGIAALALAFWLLAAGIHVIYGKRALPAMRYLRWLALVLLVAAPLFTYLFPQSAFAWGGALGSESVLFLNGLLGKAGTGMVLLAVTAFVVFVVFALDVRPLLRRARYTARTAYNAVAPTPSPDEINVPEPAPVQAVAPPVTPTPLSAMDTVIVTDPVPDIKPLDHLPAEAPAETPFPVHVAPAPEPVPFIGPAAASSRLQVDLDTGEVLTPVEIPDPIRPPLPPPILSVPVMPEVALEVPEPPAPLPKKKPVEETEPSLEVIQVAEKPAPVTVRHGAHITVADNEPYAPELDLPDYQFPTLDLLEERNQGTVALDTEELEKNKSQIIQTLRSFGIEIQQIKATVGPTVTLYEIVPAEGVRISKIRNLEDDIALNLAALGIRIIAPIPGKGTIGIEVPNAHKQIVPMRALLSSEKFVNAKMSLPVALGKTISNENYIIDLATMPHLLMAGATGQGKSVGINAILVSLLYKKHPSQLKFVMVDPKKVELSIYKTIEKHFLAKLPNEEDAIITDTKKVIYTLNALCIEMDNRYELLKEAGTRNIKEYNDKFMARRLNPERGHKYLPFIVLVVDEFADLIMTAGKEVEMPIARLAQLARAVGIHLIIATQRPSVNVITGTIKANFPGRVAFKVSAKVDSRTILDAGGAEQLVGRGDMLVSHGSELIRLQCAFVDTPEVESIVDFIGSQRGYPSAFELPEYEGADDDGAKESVDLTNRDAKFTDCARVVVQSQSGSTSMLQRKFNLGYNRAGRIMDQLEAAGIVGPASGSKPRDVLYHTEAELEEFLQSLG